MWSDEQVYLGHLRLSIIDLSETGHQPMSNDSGEIWISYNGEIYNYREIRKQLEQGGYRFNSQSDTEVVIKAYERWGTECVHRFRGMFAFALWDGRRKRLLLFRDRAGVKPLYYGRLGETIVFGSELRAVRQFPGIGSQIDANALSHFLQFGYISPPSTIFTDVKTVRPGHFVEIDIMGDTRETKYWDIQSIYQQGMEEQRSGLWDRRTESDVEEEFEELLAQAFRYRMVADVPVGLFLSGGIDSTAVAAILAKKLGIDLNTYTIGFHDKHFNEAESAKQIATELGTNHTELYIDQTTLLEGIDQFTEVFDEPFGDSSGVPTHLLCGLARKHVKVALSADGGDELFCGYSRYRVANRYYQLQKQLTKPISRVAAAFMGALPVTAIEAAYSKLSSRDGTPAGLSDKVLKVKRMLRGRNAAGIYEGATSDWFGNAHSAILESNEPPPVNDIAGRFKALDDASFMHKMMCTDFQKYMVDDVLVKLDRASMSVSLEVREPFLDHDLVDFSVRLPLHYKYRDGQSKYILRKILSRYVEPHHISRPKQGFAAPLGAWLRGPLRRLVEQQLSPARIGSTAVFSVPAVEKALKRFYADGEVSANEIWYLLEFQLWHDRWA